MLSLRRTLVIAILVCALCGVAAVSWQESSFQVADRAAISSMGLRAS